MEFTQFHAYPNAHLNEKLPPLRKYVLVMVKNLDPRFPNPVVVGYLKHHAGVKEEPYFVTPGASINSPNTDDRVICWCDCLPDDFEIPKGHRDSPFDVKAI